MGKREERAIEVLQNGGYFRKQLEANHFGAEKFRVRLRDAAGRVVPGIGEVTFIELRDTGKLQWRDCRGGTAYPEEYVLKGE